MMGGGGGDDGDDGDGDDDVSNDVKYGADDSLSGSSAVLASSNSIVSVTHAASLTAYARCASRFRAAEKQNAADCSARSGTVMRKCVRSWKTLGVAAKHCLNSVRTCCGGMANLTAASHGVSMSASRDRGAAVR